MPYPRKLTQEQAAEARELLRRRRAVMRECSFKALMRRFGVSHQTLRRIERGASYRQS